jgi:hypothetical protein
MTSGSSIGSTIPVILQADLRDALADVNLRQIELGRTTQADVKKSQIAAQTAVITKLQAQLTSTRQQRTAALTSVSPVIAPVTMIVLAKLGHNTINEIGE